MMHISQSPRMAGESSRPLESFTTARLLEELDRTAAFLREVGIGDAAMAVEHAARRIQASS